MFFFSFFLLVSVWEIGEKNSNRNEENNYKDKSINESSDWSSRKSEAKRDHDYFFTIRFSDFSTNTLLSELADSSTC